MKKEAKKTPAKKMSIAKTAGTPTKSAASVNVGKKTRIANPPPMTEADFNCAMKIWAKKFAITEQQRDELSSCILNYEASSLPPDYWKNLQQGNFYKSIAAEECIKKRSLKPDPPAEKIESEIWALQQALERLSYEARDRIACYTYCDDPEISHNFHYSRLLTLQACERSGQVKMKEGRRRPAARIKFLKTIYSDFENITGQTPTSSPEGCFCTLARYALGRYGLALESLSRDVQKIKQFKADMEYLDWPDWDPDFQ